MCKMAAKIRRYEYIMNKIYKYYEKIIDKVVIILYICIRYWQQSASGVFLILICRANLEEREGKA